MDTVENKKEKEFRLGIAGIRSLGYKINEPLFIPSKEVKIDLSHVTSYDVKENLVFINLTCRFYYENAETDLLIESKVQNAFFIPDLANYVIKDTLQIPELPLTTMVSLTLSHSRAVLATQLLGTIFRFIFLPLMDAIEVAKNFYPHIKSNSESVS